LFGLLMLISKLDLLFTSVLAAGIIYAGYRLIRRRPEHADDQAPSMMERQWARQILKEDALDRWEREHRLRQR
ncbi:hypothetical protein MXD63_46405, partial [Frankia sp. Cpl3]|nr:hypothetical protein [Frankia sp. Cpl3]